MTIQVKHLFTEKIYRYMRLKGKRVAILATDGFEEDELFKPLAALKKEGAEVDVVSYKDGPIRGWKSENWGKSIDVDKKISQVNVNQYNGLMIPGGVANPDSMRQDAGAIHFVRDFFREGKPVASICHGPQVLIEAEVLKDRKVTSYPSIKKDLINAGAHWVDEEVVVDEGLVTSRNPGDLPAFTAKLVEEVAEGVHEDQTA